MPGEAPQGDTAQVAGGAPQVSQAGERRLARVESLRALAALAVCAAHAWGFAHHHRPEGYDTFLERVIYGGGFGVYLFFALSGYLLFWPFARHYWGEGARIDLRRYAVNRFVRIMPLYWTVVIVLLILQEGGGTWEQWWRFMLLWENFSQETFGTVDGALWSLVVEVHFYLLLPFLAAGIARLAPNRRQATIVVAGIGLLSLLLWIGKVTTAEHPDRLWSHNIPATFYFFVPGMLLALARLTVEERRPAWLEGPAAHSGLWLALSVGMWMIVFSNFRYSPLSTLASFLAVGACVLPLRESLLRRVLDWRPLAAVGVVSYSLYVWHSRVEQNLIKWDPFPDTTLGIMFLTIPLAIAAAFVSYRVVEEPFLRLRRRWSDASAPIPADPLPGRAVSESGPAR
jgi:acetyltransferase